MLEIRCKPSDFRVDVYYLPQIASIGIFKVFIFLSTPFQGTGRTEWSAGDRGVAFGDLDVERRHNLCLSRIARTLLHQQIVQQRALLLN